MKKMIAILVLLMVGYFGWNFYNKQQALKANDSEMAQSNGQPIMSKEGAAKPTRNATLTISTAKPKLITMASTMVASGTVQPWQEAVIGSELSGVRLIDVLVDVGDSVTSGQLLATLSDDSLQADYQQARAGVLQAKANYTNAKSNADRMRSIADKGIIPQQQIDAAITQEQVGQMQLEAANAVLRAQKIRLDNTKVTAPDSGIISKRMATVGGVVTPGQELFRLIRQNRLEWRAEVTAAEVTSIQVGDTVKLLLANGETINGAVRSIAPIADATTRNITVYVDIPHHRQIRSGEYLSGQFAQGQSRALVVPNEAVVLRDGFSYIFTVDDESTVHRRKVTVGQRMPDGAEIVEGIDDTALIAVEGAGFLNDGDFVRVAQ